LRGLCAEMVLQYLTILFLLDTTESFGIGRCSFVDLEISIVEADHGVVASPAQVWRAI
jgi:hypothetical protein